MGLGQNPPRDHLIIIPAGLDSNQSGHLLAAGNHHDACERRHHDENGWRQRQNSHQRDHLNTRSGRSVALPETNADVLSGGWHSRYEEESRSEVAITIFPADGSTNWPSPLPNFRRDSFQALPPAHAARASRQILA